MRSSSLWVIDGSVPALSGSVNNAGGYPAVKPFTTPGTSILTVTGLATAVVGQYVQFVSHMQYYEIIDVTSTTITLYPALLSDVDDAEAINVLGNGIYAKIGEGNMTYSEKRNLVYVRDRGFLDTMKIGDDEPMDVSIDFTWEFLRSAGVGFPPTIEEAMYQVGQASNWVSTSTDACEPYAVDVVLLDIPPCGTDAESITLHEFRWTSLDHDWRGGKVSIKGSCNTLHAVVVHSIP